jgi:hypothetical protein
MYNDRMGMVRGFAFILVLVGVVCIGGRRVIDQWFGDSMFHSLLDESTA